MTSNAPVSFYRDGLGLSIRRASSVAEFENGAVAFFNLEFGLKLATLAPQESRRRPSGLPRQGRRAGAQFSLATQRRLAAGSRCGHAAGRSVPVPRIVKPAQADVLRRLRGLLPGSRRPLVGGRVQSPASLPWAEAALPHGRPGSAKACRLPSTPPTTMRSPTTVGAATRPNRNAPGIAAAGQCQRSGRRAARSRRAPPPARGNAPPGAAPPTPTRIPGARSRPGRLHDPAADVAAPGLRPLATSKADTRNRSPEPTSRCRHGRPPLDSIHEPRTAGSTPAPSVPGASAFSRPPRSPTMTCSPAEHRRAGDRPAGLASASARGR